MIKVRGPMFETNSSSTHSLIVCEEPEYESLKSGEAFIDTWEDTIVPRTLVIKELWQEVQDDMEFVCNLLKDEGISAPAPITLEWLQQADDYVFIPLLNEILDGRYKPMWYYFESAELEGYSETYTTSHGDVVHMFGLYGRDC